PPRRSVRRKRPPPPWTTLHLWQPARSPLINRGKLFKQTEPLLFRRVTTRHDKLDVTFLGFVHIAGTMK
ncbi:MAG: hypothetical protein WA147_09045, partial [Polaromonas sp.]